MSGKKATGRVISTKMDKTAVVATEKRITHKKYGKVLVRTKRHKAHNEFKECYEGDLVSIRETAPWSKTKRWVIEEIISRSSNLIPITGENEK